MDGLGLLVQAREAGLKVDVQGDRLVIRGPRRAEPLARLLIEHKPLIMRTLAKIGRIPIIAINNVIAAQPAIVINSATGMPPEWAEGHARVLTIGRPARVPADRWERFQQDTQRIFAEHDGGSWATTAAALGLSLHQIFGCDRARPHEYAARQGLLWRLDGRDIVALTDAYVCVIGEGLTTCPATNIHPAAPILRHWFALPQPDESPVFPCELER